ncbi:MAG: V-type ATP synthase subunit A, partial [Clostridia bacterium]|nr:V-type ATP synthase subunit A [Clostridia bacterium]
MAYERLLELAVNHVNGTVNGYIFGINGPVVEVKGSDEFRMHETVLVGNEKLIGEVIGIDKDASIIQVYEETTGLKPNEPVVSMGKPFSVVLAPGILGNIFDGIERPLKDIEKLSGAFIARGASVNALDESKKWDVSIDVKVGDVVSGGSIIAKTQETSLIEHRIMVPPDVEGTVSWAAENGSYTI